MNRRQNVATLSAVLDDHIHWLGRWQCAVMFPDKVGENNPYGPDTLIRWLADPEQGQVLAQPAVRRLQQLHDTLHDQAYELGKVAPRARPPYEAYEEFLRNFDSFIAQLRRTERLLASAARMGGLAALQSGRAMEIVLQEITGLMQRAESKGYQCVLAVAGVDRFDQVKSHWDSAITDYIVTEVVGRVGQNLRPFDDVFRLNESYSVWFMQQVNIEDAVRAADRVRRKVGVLPVEFPDGRSESVTLSAGLVPVDFGQAAGDLLERALAALRTAQDRGTGQICAPAAE